MDEVEGEREELWWEVWWLLVVVGVVFVYVFLFFGWKLVRDGMIVVGRNCDVDGDGGEFFNLIVFDFIIGVGFFEYW